MMHSVVENKHKPITWAFKAITNVCLKGVTEQKVIQKWAGKKRERERESVVLLSCISVSFYNWSRAFHPRQDISDAYEAPWCDLFWHIKSCPCSSTCISLSFPSKLLLMIENKLWYWNTVFVCSRSTATYVQSTGRMHLCVFMHMFIHNTVTQGTSRISNAED